MDRGLPCPMPPLLTNVCDARAVFDRFDSSVRYLLSTEYFSTSRCCLSKEMSRPCRENQGPIPLFVHSDRTFVHNNTGTFFSLSKVIIIVTIHRKLHGFFLFECLLSKGRQVLAPRGMPLHRYFGRFRTMSNGCHHTRFFLRE